jgi:hypothetical protein
MTEAVWLSSEDPSAMLAWLQNPDHASRLTAPLMVPDGPLLSSRKLRLFAIACCRANGGQTAEAADHFESAGRHYMSDRQWAEAWAMGLCPLSQPGKAAILREIAGNPFVRKWEWPKRLLHASGHHWAVINMASAAYERRRADGTLENDRLAVLSDAMEESGWGDAELLAHLRSAGPHYRGCWAIDCIRGDA